MFLSKKCSVPFQLCVHEFSLNTSRATGTGMLVNRALTSKDTRVSSDVTFCP